MKVLVCYCFSLRLGTTSYTSRKLTEISIDSYDFYIDTQYCFAVKDYLGIRKDNTLSCLTNHILTFQIHHISIVITSDIYMEKKNSVCYSRIVCSSTGNKLPVTVLKKKCLLFDYKHYRIGLTDRVTTSNDPTLPYPTNPREKATTVPSKLTTTVTPTKQPVNNNPVSNVFMPCKKRIVFAIDSSESNKYFNVSQIIFKN